MPQKMIYPIGIQSFPEIIRRGLAYVDKTALVHDLANTFKYVFLSRPRRFGKSLLVSTLASYFEGEKELFRGLALEKLEASWDKYPVLRFDFAKAPYDTPEQLRNGISLMLMKYEAIYGKGKDEAEPNERLEGIISRACEKTGRQAVVLIDEYDSPLLDVGDAASFEGIQKVLKNFYSPLKSCDERLRFVFVTGITRFSQIGILSGLNNLKAISMNPAYHAICGITEEELRSELGEGVRQFAQANSISADAALERLRENYDGYHFAKNCPGLYNPFSLLNALADRAVGNYWFSTGAPTALIKMLKKFDVPAEGLTRQWLSSADFDLPTQEAQSPSAFLYQSGYLTIKDYDPVGDLYQLDLPNREVSTGFWHALIPLYVGRTTHGTATTVVARMWTSITKDDMDGALRCMQEFLGTVPYARGTNTEGHYQTVLFVIFKLLGKFADVEVHTARGRVDVVIYAARTIFVIEVKLGKSAQAALSQVEKMGYADRFVQLGKKVVKVGVNFSPETRTISDWKIAGE